MKTTTEAENQTANELAVWLKQLPHGMIEMAVPVEVTIADHTWVGALYCELHHAGDKERVVTDGPMKPGDTLRSYRLYLLGARYAPKSRPEKWVAVYDLPDDKRQPLEPCYDRTNEWYVACHSPPHEPKNSNAPFGAFWIMILHQQMNFGYYKDWKVDTGEQKPYDRRPMDVKYLKVIPHADS